MGVSLKLRGNQKGDATTGRQPDENDAREVLQLFSIGLVALAADGTPRAGAAPGSPQDTYDQATISRLARVFTGWEFDGFNGADDVGQGRLLPTPAVDQLAATLAAWMGV